MPRWHSPYLREGAGVDGHEGDRGAVQPPRDDHVLGRKAESVLLKHAVGLSYTDFTYSEVRLASWTEEVVASFDVTNSGSVGQGDGDAVSHPAVPLAERAGDEAAQEDLEDQPPGWSIANRERHVDVG
ncbi:unnamed protein product [Phytophthora lilii]|uniref:Unnamed protein product n=1 Tax=Phytophthora lilii TaxID=2077276 RepID=A0A9W6XKQ2_9STRA|nr:unnamed protein product [Phytophthora lilii]